MKQSTSKENKILVTGGSGFLGSHLVKTLSDNGYEVRVFDTNLLEFDLPNVEYVKGDLNSLSQLENSCKGIKTIFHFAALADLDEAKDKPVDTMKINLMGTLNLLEASRKQNVGKIIFSSSIYVHSRSGGFYRVSKHACELLLEEYFNRYNLNYIILRYGTLYGPGADKTNSVYHYLSQSLHSGAVDCIGTGDEVREYIDVRDAAEISLKAIKDKYNGETLIIAGNHRIQLKELLEMINEILGNKVKVSYGEGKPAHYKYSPYSYIPRPGKKLSLDYYRDLGQGLIEILSEIEEKIVKE